MSQPTDNKILLLTNTRNKQTFEIRYRPATVGIDQSVTLSSSGILPSQRELQVSYLALRTINISKLRLEGKAEVAKVDMLLKWLQPQPITGGGTTSAPPGGGEGPAGTPDKAEPCLLTLHLSGTVVRTVALEKVKADYLRFNSSGDPIRAELSLTLVEVEKPNVPSGTGTAGGEPSHQVTQGEDLSHVAAKANDNNPEYRPVAQANDIDDPNRVPNGTNLQLPVG